MRDWLPAFELATRHTLAVIAAAPEGRWDEAPAAGLKTLREQLAHIALVRESICRQLAGEPTAGLGLRFATDDWLRGGGAELSAAFGDHALRCAPLLARIEEAKLDAPFTTPFGNRSTPRNYLRSLLLEEQHHRAQMTLALRLFGVEPPEYPGRAWVELGVDQDA